jgi:hypothetical protein
MILHGCRFFRLVLMHQKNGETCLCSAAMLPGQLYFDRISEKFEVIFGLDFEYTESA